MSALSRYWLYAVAIAVLGIAPAHAADKGDIVIAVNELPRGLEPADDTGNVDVRATYSIFDTLIRRDSRPQVAAMQAGAVTLREVPELATRIAGLVSGEFDVIVDITPDQIPVLARYKDIDVHSVVLENSHVIYFNTTAPAIKDKRLRQALSYAIDRK